MSSVLILGNGISRLLYIDQIREWEGEIWGCNFIFVEMGDRLDRITGHTEVMRRARVWKELHKYDYKITTAAEKGPLPHRVRGNSGMCLVSLAVAQGYKEIILCGFDFSGKDVWAPGLENRNIISGLRVKFREITKHYPHAWERIQFWGFVDKKSIKTFDYKKHIEHPDYQELYEKFTPLIDPENV